MGNMFIPTSMTSAELFGDEDFPGFSGLIREGARLAQFLDE